VKGSAGAPGGGGHLAGWSKLATWCAKTQLHLSTREKSSCAGLPNNDQKWFCPANSSSCYFYNGTSAAYSVHRSGCQGMGGYMVAYNTGEWHSWGDGVDSMQQSSPLMQT